MNVIANESLTCLKTDLFFSIESLDFQTESRTEDDVAPGRTVRRNASDNISTRDLLALIGQIYDAAIDPNQWQALVTQLADVYHGAAIAYDEEPMEGGARLFAGVNIDLAWKEPFETYYSKIKPWRERLAHVRAGEVLQPSAWIDERSFRNTEYYNDCLAPLDLFYNLGLTLFNENKVHTAVALVRPHRVGDFTTDEYRLSEMLVPHLQRAVRMNRYLHSAALERQAMLRGLDGLSVGVILAAGDGRVLFVNRVAEKVLCRGDGLSTRQQRLHAMVPTLTQELHRRIREAADTGAGSGTQVSGVLSLPCRSGDSVSLLICPFPVGASGASGPTVPTALIFIGGSAEATTVRQNDLRQIYGLTAAEAKLVGALLAGMPLRNYAAESGISTETAKTQLRQIFAKTGQRRQVDLIRHILSNPIIQLAPKELAATGNTATAPVKHRHDN